MTLHASPARRRKPMPLIQAVNRACEVHKVGRNMCMYLLEGIKVHLHPRSKTAQPCPPPYTPLSLHPCFHLFPNTGGRPRIEGQILLSAVRSGGRTGRCSIVHVKAVGWPPWPCAPRLLHRRVGSFIACCENKGIVRAKHGGII